jgi:hypothetical protein
VPEQLHGTAHSICVLGRRVVRTHTRFRAAQLVNYPAYRDHEVKAMWEWLRRTGRKLEVIGMMGPLQQVPPTADCALCKREACSVVAEYTGHVTFCIAERMCCISSCCPAIEPAEARRRDGPKPAVRPGRLPAVSGFHCFVRHAGPGRQQLADGTKSARDGVPLARGDAYPRDTLFGAGVCRGRSRLSEAQTS